MKPRLPVMSLRTRVMLQAGLAMTLMLMGNTARRQHEMDIAGMRALDERASLLASIQAKALSVPIWNLDRDQLGAALDALTADPDFVAASVVLPDGKLLDQRLCPAGSTDSAPLVAVSRDIRYLTHGELRTLGTLHLSLSATRLNAALRAARRSEAAWLTLLIGLVLLVLYMTLRQLVRPLDRLAAALSRLAGGDRDTPIPASDRDDEVGAVARGLEVFRDTAFRLIKAEGTYRAVFDGSPLGIIGTDEAGRIHSLNEAMLTMTGYADPAALAAAMHQDDGTAFYVQPGRRAELYATMRDGAGFVGEISEIRRADGSLALISLTGRAVRDETGRVLGFSSTMEDITDRQRRREEEQLRLRAAMECASDAILIVDAHGTALFVNPAFERCFGYGREAFSGLGGLPAVLLDPVASTSLAKALRNGEAWQKEADIRLADGQALPLLIRCSPIRDGQGARFGCVVICTDLSDRRQAEARIQYMAHYDWLTGLPNRVLFRERLGAALASAREGGSFAILCMDLDRFKTVNDTLGHAAGDRLLQLVGARLQGVVREDDTVARIGGDEFIVIQQGISNPHQAVTLAERLIRDMSQPFDLNGREAQIGASVGIALAPQNGTDPDRLLGFADLALYEAKTQGKGQLRLFTPDMDEMLRARTELEQDLRNAVARNRLYLHFQPQYRLADGALLGAEALLRWTDPTRGVVPPSLFIPVAEETGLIHPIGRFVLQTACREAAAWPSPLRVAVNVSPAQFHASDLIDTVGRTLRDTGLAPCRLELEITEGVMLHDTEATRGTLLGLKALGVRISLDDFGTGYSSLSYLRRMPFDKIKIDRSFVASLGQDDAATALVRSIIGLAKGLGLETNAEGVETPLQARILRDEGCGEVQGYHFGRPMPADAFVLLQPRNVFAKSA